MVASDHFKRYFEQIEAVKNYHQVKKERDQLAEENPKLKQRISELTETNDDLAKRLEGEVELRKRLDERLKSEAARAKRLESDVKKLAGRLESTLRELESLKAWKLEFAEGEKLTLEEAKEAFIQAHNDEVEKRSDERFKELKADYEARMPRLVQQRLLEILEKPRDDWPVEVANVIDTRARAIADGILLNRESWPPHFLKYYLQEVSTSVRRQLDQEFHRRVDEKSQEVAEKKLKILEDEAWPKWFSEKVKPQIDRSILQVLGRQWSFTCDKCGTRFDLTLAPADLAELLRDGWIDVECPNPGCKDHGLLGWPIWRHRMRIRIETLIAALMGEKQESGTGSG